MSYNRGKRPVHSDTAMIEIIRKLADLIGEKVDLENSAKIFLIDIIGKNAGISVLTLKKKISTAKPPLFGRFGFKRFRQGTQKPIEA